MSFSISFGLSDLMTELNYKTMRKRLAKKIVGRQWHKVSPYWFKRAVEYFDGIKKDDRVRQAIKRLHYGQKSVTD